LARRRELDYDNPKLRTIPCFFPRTTSYTLGMDLERHPHRAQIRHRSLLDLVGSGIRLITWSAWSMLISITFQMTHSLSMDFTKYSTSTPNQIKPLPTHLAAARARTWCRAMVRMQSLPLVNKPAYVATM